MLKTAEKSMANLFSLILLTAGGKELATIIQL